MKPCDGRIKAGQLVRLEAWGIDLPACADSFPLVYDF